MRRELRPAENEAATGHLDIYDLFWLLLDMSGAYFASTSNSGGNSSSILNNYPRISENFKNNKALGHGVKGEVNNLQRLTFESWLPGETSVDFRR